MHCRQSARRALGRQEESRRRRQRADRRRATRYCAARLVGLCHHSRSTTWCESCFSVFRRRRVRIKAFRWQARRRSCSRRRARRTRRLSICVLEQANDLCFCQFSFCCCCQPSTTVAARGRRDIGETIVGSATTLSSAFRTFLSLNQHSLLTLLTTLCRRQVCRHHRQRRRARRAAVASSDARAPSRRRCAASGHHRWRASRPLLLTFNRQR